MHKVTGIVLTRNSAKNITKTLKSINWCDEKLIIDDYSSDNTSDLATKYGARVIARRLENDFSKQRDFANKKAKNDWVLHIDSDEIVTQDLASEIKLTLQNPKFNSYYIPRRNIYFGRSLRYGEWGSGNIIRLIKKGTGKWKRAVHEEWKSNYPAGQLYGEIQHFSPTNVNDLVMKFQQFTFIHANENSKVGKRSHLWKITLYPLIKFIVNYLLKKGYKDGTRGFIMAVMMSFHSYISWSIQWLQKR